MNDLREITYCNEQVYSNYHRRDEIIEKLKYNDAINTVVGYVIWETDTHISLFQGFNRIMYLNGIVIGKGQIIDQRQLNEEQEINSDDLASEDL